MRGESEKSVEIDEKATDENERGERDHASCFEPWQSTSGSKMMARACASNGESYSRVHSATHCRVKSSRPSLLLPLAATAVATAVALIAIRLS